MAKAVVTPDMPPQEMQPAAFLSSLGSNVRLVNVTGSNYYNAASTISGGIGG